ncbi:hypothetical protein GGX14DRAFT_576302 [Mycena pura]|uniref:Uncharacterized protein n=1 Tax=Mycena pura TaxID=153505 RepID=A0AAD6UXP9_9AGAR|nr:hypothetical protein GGX14DRAFT_576302 [Mycena pura]
MSNLSKYALRLASSSRPMSSRGAAICSGVDSGAKLVKVRLAMALAYLERTCCDPGLSLTSLTDKRMVRAEVLSVEFLAPGHRTTKAKPCQDGLTAECQPARWADRFNGIIRRAFPPDGSSVPVSLGLDAEKGVRGRLPWSCGLPLLISSSSSPPPLLSQAHDDDDDMEPSLAPHFIGVLLATIFYGITLAQAFAYFRTYTTDPRHMKLIVALLLLLDTAQVSLVFTSIYGYAIRARGDQSALQYVSKPFLASMGVTSAVAFTVQMIYAYRVWRLSAGNAYLTASIISLAIVALGSSTALTTKTIRNPRWDETRVSNLPAGLILASTVTCDLLIAGAQVWLFHRHRLARVLAPGKLFPFPFPLRRRSGTGTPRDSVEHSGPLRIGGTVAARRGSLLVGLGLAGPRWMGLGSGAGPGSAEAAVEAGKGDSEPPGSGLGLGACPEGGHHDHDCSRCAPSSQLSNTRNVEHEQVGRAADDADDTGGQRGAANKVRLNGACKSGCLLKVAAHSIDATIFLVLFLTCPEKGVYLVPYILLSNCYVNSFLSILNSRRILRGLVENPEHLPVSFDFALDTG